MTTTRDAPISVSVVVAAYNEQDHMARLLHSLARQSHPPIEVIVVDDGSRDHTASIAQSFGADVLRLRHGGPAIARNAGAKVAAGEVLVLLDGDMSCDPDYISHLVKPIADDRALSTFTKELFVGNPDNRWAQSYCFIRCLPFPRVISDAHPNRWANVRAVRTGAFLDAGGYDEVGYGEDMTLAPKLGELALAAPGAICWHFNPASLGEIFENALWIGRGHDIGEVEHPWADNSPWTAIRKGARDWRRGAPAEIMPARFAYHAGVLVGLIARLARPARHWK